MNRNKDHNKQLNRSFHQSSVAFAVDPPAIIPDLSILPCQRANVPHLNHGRGEVPEEIFLAAREPENYGSGCGRGGWVGQHDLVGVELGAALQEVAIVLVENCGRDLVQVLQCSLGLPGRAVLPRELALHFAECVRS
jgi:hypothetical protein